MNANKNYLITKNDPCFFVGFNLFTLLLSQFTNYFHFLKCPNRTPDIWVISDCNDRLVFLPSYDNELTQLFDTISQGLSWLLEKEHINHWFLILNQLYDFLKFFVLIKVRSGKEPAQQIFVLGCIFILYFGYTFYTVGMSQ